jgi:hypothetical protein
MIYFNSFGRERHNFNYDDIEVGYFRYDLEGGNYSPADYVRLPQADNHPWNNYRAIDHTKDKELHVTSFGKFVRMVNKLPMIKRGKEAEDYINGIYNGTHREYCINSQTPQYSQKETFWRFLFGPTPPLHNPMGNDGCPME